MGTGSATLRREVIALARSAEEFATDVIGQQHARADDKRVIQLAQLARMLRTFEAIRTLVEANLNDGAGAVLRCLLEQYFVFRAIVQNPSLLQRAASEVDGERYKALEGLIRLDPAERASELTPETLKAALSEFERSSGFNVHDWATASGMRGAYLTLYRLLSVYAHGSLAAIEKYIETDEAGTPRGVRSWVALTESTEFLLSAVAMLLECVEDFDNLPHTDTKRAAFRFFSQEQQRLYQLYWVTRN